MIEGDINFKKNILKVYYFKTRIILHIFVLGGVQMHFERITYKERFSVKFNQLNPDERSEILGKIYAVDKHGLREPDMIVSVGDGDLVQEIQKKSWLISYKSYGNQYSIYVKEVDSKFEFESIEIQE
jgi:hypothetical protein